jgi:DNA/RNA-binding domain of Phe-tRNA-synthetase-like protein
MEYVLKIMPEVSAELPDYRAEVIYASGLDNRKPTPQAEAILREAEDRFRRDYPGDSWRDQPHLVALRAAFEWLGVKAKKYPCSAEGLIRRVASGVPLPSVNLLVNLYNAVSIGYRTGDSRTGEPLPIGGEDRDRLTSDLMLHFATGTEPFDATRDGQPVIDHPDPHELIWSDSTGVTCRRWNWRQGKRTAITTATRNAYFVLDRLEPLPLERLDEAAEDLIALIRRFNPGADIRRVRLGGMA